MSATQENSCVSLRETNGLKEAAKRWGNVPSCHNSHEGGQPPRIYNVEWIHLGHDSDSRLCGVWADDTVRPLFIRRTPGCDLDWRRFLESARLNEYTAARNGYGIKMPTLNWVMPIGDEDEWANAISHLQLLLERDNRMWCRKNPPVIIVCSMQQAFWCHARGWQDVVGPQYEYMAGLLGMSFLFISLALYFIYHPCWGWLHDSHSVNAMHYISVLRMSFAFLEKHARLRSLIRPDRTLAQEENGTAPGPDKFLNLVSRPQLNPASTDPSREAAEHNNGQPELPQETSSESTGTGEHGHVATTTVTERDEKTASVPGTSDMQPLSQPMPRGERRDLFVDAIDDSQDNSSGGRVSSGNDLEHEVDEELLEFCTNDHMQQLATWQQACHFFNHDPSNQKEGVKLPGMRTQLRGYQMHSAFIILLTLKDRTYSGVFDAAKPGLGKTLTALAVSAVIVLCRLSREHYVSHKTAHTGDMACPFNYLFGVECGCIPSSFTRVIVRQTRRAAQLIVVPPRLVPQWCSAIEQHTANTIELRNGQTVLQRPLLFIGTIKGSRLTQMTGMEHVNFTKRTFVEDVTTKESTLTLAELKKTLYSVVKGKSDLRQCTVRAYDEMLSGSAKQADGKFVVLTLSQLLCSTQRLGLDLRHIRHIKLVACGEAAEEFGAECVLLLCGSRAFANKEIPKMFSLEFTVTTSDNKSLTVVVRDMLRPSVLAYDEWIEAKSKECSTIKGLLEIAGCNDPKHEDKGSQQERALTSLLCGTPMPKGPSDFEGVLPMVKMYGLSNGSDYNEDMQSMTQPYNRAKKPQSGGDDDDDTTRANRRAAEDEWKAQFSQVIGPCLIVRKYGQRFLDITIPDPRPMHYDWPRVEIVIEPEYERQRQTQVKKLHARIKELKDAQLGRQSKGGKEASESAVVRKIMCSAEYHSLARSEMVPSLTTILGGSLLFNQKLDDFEQPRGANSKQLSKVHASLRNVASQLKCHSLVELSKIIAGVGDECRRADKPVDNFLVFTLFPHVALCIAAWLEHDLGSKAHVQLLLADVATDSREAIINKLAQRHRDDKNTQIVYVSTYAISSTGVDGLQGFANRLVMFGLPWTSAVSEQALGRIYRSGQIRDHSHRYYVGRGHGTCDGRNYILQEEKEMLINLDSLYAIR